MVKKHALLLGLAILAEISVVLLAASQLRPLAVFLALTALSVVGVRQLSSVVASGDSLTLVAAGLMIVPGFISGIVGALAFVAPFRVRVRGDVRDAVHDAVESRLALLVPSSFPVGGDRAEQRGVGNVTDTRKNPEQESVDELLCASAGVLCVSRRQL